jgi:primosomal protein N'
MKPIGIMSTAALFLLLGIAAPANGRQEKPKEEAAKPQKQQQQAKPEKQQPQPKAPKQEQQAKAPKQEQQAKPEKQQQQAQAPKQQQHASPEKQQQQAKSQQPQNGNSAKQQQHSNAQQQQGHQQQASSSHAPQRTQQAMATQRSQPALRLSARGSGRIPDDRFHANFGRGHDFHMGNPVLVGGYSRFQYGGFWFGFVQPWPSGWYYTDDVYIDYVDGGYYMYNPYYPGARFSISVVI